MIAKKCKLCLIIWMTECACCVAILFSLLATSFLVVRDECCKETYQFSSLLSNSQWKEQSSVYQKNWWYPNQFPKRDLKWLGRRQLQRVLLRNTRWKRKDQSRTPLYWRIRQYHCNVSPCLTFFKNLTVITFANILIHSLTVYFKTLHIPALYPVRAPPHYVQYLLTI